MDIIEKIEDIQDYIDTLIIQINILEELLNKENSNIDISTIKEQIDAIQEKIKELSDILKNKYGGA